MEYCALTDIGKVREKNQDQVAVSINNKDQVLGVVCDGMGGHNAGEIASHVAKEHVLTCFRVNPPFRDDEEVMNWLIDASLEANGIVRRMANMQEDTKGMGTTIAMCVVDGDELYTCHVGDSRVYIYDTQTIQQVTKDHTLVNELVERGALNEEEAKTHQNRNILTQAIGIDKIKPDIQKLSREGKNVLICSDGLYNSLSDYQILEILNKEGTVNQKARHLIEQANTWGGRDNIAVVLIEGGKDYE